MIKENNQNIKKNLEGDHPQRPDPHHPWRAQHLEPAHQVSQDLSPVIKNQTLVKDVNSSVPGKSASPIEIATCAKSILRGWRSRLKYISNQPTRRDEGACVKDMCVILPFLVTRFPFLSLLCFWFYSTHSLKESNTIYVPPSWFAILNQSVIFLLQMNYNMSDRE